MGEQSAKSLRGAKMNDVIFQGGENSKSLNLAEVNLNFSNEDKALDLAYDKVKISRRIFRDGDNEYRINGKKVRLKDVRELFLDTGVGKEGYSIISQGRIEEIISSSAKDRRNIFEEASGIAKHKFRRDEANKKLEKVTDDLEIIDREWEYKKKDLALLSGYKDNFLKNKALTEELDEKSYFYMKDKSRSLLDKKEKLLGKIEKLDQELTASTSELDEIRKKLSPYKKNQESLEEKIKIIRENIDKYTKDIEKSENKLLLNKEKSAYNNKDMTRLLENIKSNEDRRAKVKKDLEKEEANLLAYKEKLKDSEDKSKLNENNIEGLRVEIEKLKSLKNEEELKLEKLKEEIYNYEVDQKSKALFDQKKAEEDKKRLEKLKKLEDEHKNLNMERQKLDQEIISDDKDRKDFAQRLKAKAEELSKKKSDLEELIKDNNDNNIKLKTSISEFKLQKENIDKNRGYIYSIQDFLNKTKENGLDKLYLDSLANLISVKEGYEDVIDNLMGASLQNIVTKNKADTRDLINFVNKMKLGRITFLPIDSIKSFKKERPDEEEVIAMAYDLIEAPDNLANIIDHFLGSTVVVSDIDKAVSLSNKLKGYRIISMNLDIINTWGSMVAGNDKNRKKNTNLLNRNKKLDDLKELILTLRNKKDSYSNSYKDLMEAVSRNEEEIDLARKDFDLKEEERRLRKSKLESLDLRLANIQVRIKELGEEDEGYVSLQDKLDINELRSRLDKLKKEISDKEESLSEKEALLRDCEDEIIRLENTIEIIKRDINLLLNSTNKLRNTLNDLDNSDRLEIKLRKEIENSIAELKENDDKLRKIIEFSRTNMAKEEEGLKESIKKLDSMTLENANMVDRDKALDEKIKNFNLEKVKLDYELSSINSKYNSIVDEVKPFISMSLDNLEEKFKDKEPVKTNKTSLIEIQRKLNSIGFFDENSLENYKEANEAFDFLDKQMKDLINSKADIEKMIQKLEKEMKEEFIKNFNIINDKFMRIFKTLFIGGDAKLILDSDDSLNAGIEIEARPPSKSLKSISLLSGGEKSLTAVALLFAIFETNPAPFAILDEIDAALDETNIKRYIEYLKSLSDKTQFIMITHRQTTMQLAERIHGVTIGDNGKSKIYSIDFANN